MAEVLSAFNDEFDKNSDENECGTGELPYYTILKIISYFNDVKAMSTVQKRFIVIYNDSEVAGIILGSLSTRRPKPSFDIYFIYVSVKVRRQGIGRSAISLLESYVTQKNVKSLELCVLNGCHRQLKYWRSIGFQSYATDAVVDGHLRKVAEHQQSRDYGGFSPF